MDKEIQRRMHRTSRQGVIGQPSDLVNGEMRRIVRCLLDSDRHQTISDLHHEIAAQYTYVNISGM